MKPLLEELVVAAIRQLGMPATAALIERSRDTAHGHFTSSVAMRLAKVVGLEARDVAHAIVRALPPNTAVMNVEVAGNGFINFRLAPEALAADIRRIHELGDAYGRSSIGAGETVTVGLISSPRDVTQARYAAYRDSLANVLAAAGYDVQREELRDTSATGPVRFFRGTAPVQISSPRELSDAVGAEACRFFLLMRSQQHPFDFDLRLATLRTIENPLYAVQYAHARVSSAMKEVKARSFSFDLAAGLDRLGLLDSDTEQALIATLLRFPEEVESAAANCAPHSIVYYLRDVANAFHTYHHAGKWIVEEVDLRNARLALVLAAGRVLRNGLALIGVSAPESM